MTRCAAQTVVQLSSPPDIVEAIPFLLGFQPTESVVVLSLRGRRNTVGLTLRCDLPSAELEAAFAVELAGRMEHDGATSTVIAVFTEEADPFARQNLAEALRDALDALGIDVHEALRVGGGRWWSYACTGPCCPAEGTPLVEPRERAPSAYVAEAVLRGRAVLPDRQALVDSLAPVEFLAGEAMRQAQERAALAARTAEPLGLERDTVALVARLVRRFAEAPARLSDDEAAAIVVAASAVPVRDALCRAAAAAPDSALRTWRALLVEVVRRAQPPDDAAVATLLAVVAHLSGDGALARVALDRAFASNAGYSLARLLDDALDRQAPPQLLRQALGSDGAHRRRLSRRVGRAGG